MAFSAFSYVFALYGAFITKEITTLSPLRCVRELSWKENNSALIFIIRDDTNMTSMKIVQFSRPLSPPLPLRPKFFHPLDLGRQISNGPLPPSPSSPPPPPQPPRTKKNFFFSNKSFTICFFVALYSRVCSCPKISRNIFFIYNYSHF